MSGLVDTDNQMMDDHVLSDEVMEKHSDNSSLLTRQRRDLDMLCCIRVTGKFLQAHTREGRKDSEIHVNKKKFTQKEIESTYA